jgi:hypothetical protein
MKLAKCISLKKLHILRAEVCCRTIPKTGRYNQAYENFIKWCATNDVFDIFPFLSSRARTFFIGSNRSPNMLYFRFQSPC